MIFSIAFRAPSLGFMEITNFQACLSPILARPSVGFLMNRDKTGESLAEIISEINFPELKELRVFDCEKNGQILLLARGERTANICRLSRLSRRSLPVCGVERARKIYSRRAREFKFLYSFLGLDFSLSFATLLDQFVHENVSKRRTEKETGRDFRLQVQQWRNKFPKNENKHAIKQLI